MSAENPILGTQRYFWRKWRKMQKHVSWEPNFRYTTILLKKMKGNDRKYTKTHSHLYKTPPHTAKSKISENAEIPSVRSLFCVFTQGFSLKMPLFYNFPHETLCFFSTFLRFLHFRTRIFTKSATFFAENDS